MQRSVGLIEGAWLQEGDYLDLTERKKQEDRETCDMGSAIIYTLQHILLKWSSEMGEASSTYGDEEFKQNFGRKIWREQVVG
jgi:hypothetical protein